MNPQKAILLVGSPRLERSTSKALGDRLLAELAKRGVPSEVHFIHRAYSTPEKARAMLAAVDAADIVLFAFPLYVDQLPAPVIWACGEIAARPRKAGGPPPLLAAIVQCGFPELHQNRPAVEVMRRFAERSGFAWAGGLAMGMGGAAAGRPLPEEPKGMMRNVLAGFALAAADLAAGRPIAAETIERVGRKLMPYWLYRFMANFGMRREIRKHEKRTGKKVDAFARPHAAP